MKKGLAAFLAVIILLSLFAAGCGKKDEVPPADNVPPVEDETPSADDKPSGGDTSSPPEEPGYTFKADLILYGVPDKMLGYPINLKVGNDSIFVIDLYSTDGLIKRFNLRGEFIKKFGKMTEGLQLPADLIIDNAGNLYIADMDARCIWIYDTNGLLKDYIKPEEGEEDPFLPRSIDIDSEGNLITLSFDKIWKISPRGKVLAKYGSRGEGKGQLGAEGSEFYIGPSGIAVDGNDNIYVADTINNRIQILDRGGKFLKEINNDDVKGLFTQLMDIAVDSEGNIYITDASSYYIIKLNRGGEVLERIGGMGRQKGKFGTIGDNYGYYGPTALSISPDDFIYAVDSYNHRVQAFKASGEFIYALDSESDRGVFIYPNNIFADREGNIYVVNGDMYLDDPLNFRAIRFNSKGELVFQFVSGYNMGKFANPQAIAVNSKGNAYILDLDMIQVFSSRGQFLTSFGGRGTAPGDFGVVYSYSFQIGPSGMTIGPEDSILVADKYNDRVQKLTYDGEFVEEYSVPKPQDVAVDRIGNIYVLSAEDGTVYKFNSVGQYEDKFGGTESEPGVSFGYEGGEELGPYGIACDSQGNVYVSDTYNHRILKFSSDGEFIKMYGSYGHDGDQFAYPKGIYIDNEDNLYVADYGNHRIMRFKLER